MLITKQDVLTKDEILQAISEAEALGLIRKTGEYRLSRDGEWEPVYEAVLVN